MKVTYDHTARTFSMKGRIWSDTYPIEDLPKWLAFYRKMQAEHPKAKGAYDATVIALEAFTQEMAAASN
ncbi:hypothetical protein [Haematobacter genomosp. 1]|uniref:Uncharacterized protein n=1 Tax=Haematobacter genomosp. 1 TaxID=366618 RepID=A0A212A648_9RHOB|nr:hypothetical protein [Haematobacter genomosp. 1]OWJ74407.1 hypothetical protein CDV49_19550 [Haematobacter genomosp. 1]